MSISLRLLSIILFVLLFSLSGCKKNIPSSQDIWAGVYTSSSHPVDGLTSLVISPAGAGTLRVDIKSASGGYIFSYTTLQHVSISSPDLAIIHESVHIITGQTGLYDIQGTMSLSGSDLTFTATASQGEDIKMLNFTGHRK